MSIDIKMQDNENYLWIPNKPRLAFCPVCDYEQNFDVSLMVLPDCPKCSKVRDSMALGTWEYFMELFTKTNDKLERHERDYEHKTYSRCSCC